MERVLKRGVAGYPRRRGSGKPKVWSEGKTFPFPILSKGDWDKSQGFEKDNEFNRKWLSLCREKLKENGTIWISGTYHNIFSVAQMLNELDFRILNCITWAKTNPPPNLSCKFFTHSTEFILWARKNKKVPLFRLR